MTRTLPRRVLCAGDLVTPIRQRIASRVPGQDGSGRITAFAFDACEELSEHRH
jgi:hypothetical protein